MSIINDQTISIVLFISYTIALNKSITYHNYQVTCINTIASHPKSTYYVFHRLFIIIPSF